MNPLSTRDVRKKAGQERDVAAISLGQQKIVLCGNANTIFPPLAVFAIEETPSMALGWAALFPDRVGYFIFRGA